MEAKYQGTTAKKFSNNNQIQAGKNEGSNSTVRVRGSRIQNSNGSGGGDWRRQSGHRSSHHVNDSRSKKVKKIFCFAPSGNKICKRFTLISILDC